LLALSPITLAGQEPAASFHVNVKLVSIFVNDPAERVTPAGRAASGSRVTGWRPLP
jgi:hypothetical protein